MEYRRVESNGALHFRYLVLVTRTDNHQVVGHVRRRRRGGQGQR